MAGRWTLDGNLWTEVQGQKSDRGQKSDGRKSKLTSDVQSLATVAAMAGSGAAPRNVTLRRWLGNVELQRCKLALLQLTSRQRYCNTRRESATTLFLQLSSRQRCDVVAAALVARAQRRCCSKRRSNAAATHVTAALLQQVLQ
jgi:hypothetical protein